jgi:hypothetical protein
MKVEVVREHSGWYAVKADGVNGRAASVQVDGRAQVVVAQAQGMAMTDTFTPRGWDLRVLKAVDALGEDRNGFDPPCTRRGVHGAASVVGRVSR